MNAAEGAEKEEPSHAAGGSVTGEAPLANRLVSTKAIILPRWLSGKDYISVFN